MLQRTMPWRKVSLALGAPGSGIPNRDGFRLSVLLIDGTRRETRVVRGADGLHRLEGVEIRDVTAWLPWTTA